MTAALIREPRIGYEWGRAARLRACRDYLGVGAWEMASLLKMDRRSYQRMESGNRAVREDLWQLIAQLHTRHDEAVAALIETAAHTPGLTFQVPVREHASDWERSIIAKAMARCPKIDPKSPDDLDAEREMQPYEN